MLSLSLMVQASDNSTYKIIVQLNHFYLLLFYQKSIDIYAKKLLITF